MNILFNRPSTPEAAAIRERIFNVLPAASYQMEKLFGLFDIEFSDETETACVECRTTPRLLLNKGFLDEYCRDDGDLFLLILHELYHVILGHTRLFPRVTPIDNIVFDAVINSMLCRTVGRTVGTRLFTRINSYDSLPERLLRPPPGWPDEFKGALAGLPPGGATDHRPALRRGRIRAKSPTATSTNFCARNSPNATLRECVSARIPRGGAK